MSTKATDFLKKIADLDKIERLKSQAKEHYLTYQSEAGRYDCGLQMSEMVNPRLRAAARNFNKVMDKLAELDQTAPSTRL